MVTHIFLLSKIWDASLEAQVVSRAHRMGATGAVVVEQLIMEGTVEQQMHRGARAAADAAAGDAAAAGDKGKGKARAAIAGPPGAAAATDRSFGGSEKPQLDVHDDNHGGQQLERSKGEQ